jgi:hypothetical protein
MSGSAQSFGNPPLRSGKQGNFRATEVPLDIVRDLPRNNPYPVTISGSNNVTFTLNASESRPVHLWNGTDFISLKSTVLYTWNNTSNNILSSTGAAATDTDSVLGSWYMYAGFNDISSGISSVILRPSQTAPAAGGNYPAGVLAHPGAAAERPWTYVGFMVCTTAATPAFRAMTKIGYWYYFADVTVPTTSTWGTTSLYSAALPKLAKYGGVAQGYLETGADGSVTIGPSSTSTVGIITTSIAAATLTSVLIVPFQLPQDDTSGEFYRTDTAARGDIHVTGYRDVV